MLVEKIVSPQRTNAEVAPMGQGFSVDDIVDVFSRFGNSRDAEGFFKRSGLASFPDFQTDQGAIDLALRLLHDPVDKAFSLGYLMTKLKYSQIPHFTDLLPLNTESTQPFSIVPWHLQWHLCDTSEVRYQDAIQKGLLLPIADGSLVVKFEGKLTALCLRSCATDEGHVFVEGNWYTPVSVALMDVLESQFDSGGPVGSEPLSGKWVLMRSTTDPDLVEEARDSLGDLNSHPIKQESPETRKNMRDEVWEGYTS